MGRERTVWSFWEDGEFRGAGGARNRDSREKQLARQRAALEIRNDPEPTGPDAGTKEELLETALADAARTPGPYAVNLLNEDHATPAVRRVMERSSRTLRGLGMFALLLLILFPMFLPHLIWMRAEQQERELQAVYTELTGDPAPPPGQIPVRARQRVEARRAEVRQVLEEVGEPTVTAELSRLLRHARDRGIQLEEISLR
jgi:hypothetical protein